MTDLLDFLDVTDGGRRLGDHVSVTHVLTPDMGTLCREDNLAARAAGDRIDISPHHDDRDRIEVDLPGRSYKGLRWTRVRWRNITCPWCRSLGHAYYRHCVRTMTGRQG